MSDTDDIIAIKGRFHAPQDKYYGLFFLLINQNAGYIDTASVVVSMYSEIFKTNINDSWGVFEKKISTLKYQGDFAQSVTVDLQESFKNLAMDQDFYKDILTCVQGEDMKSLKSIFNSIFASVFHDRVMKMDIGIERLSLEELKNHQVEVEEESSPQEEGPDGLVLGIDLILAPIGGKHVNQIQPGDKLMVKIKPDSEKGNYYLDLWKLRDEGGNIRPYPAEVTEVKPVENGIRFTVKFEDGVYGQVIEEEKVLLRIFDPSKDAAKKKTAPNAGASDKAKTMSSPKNQSSTLIFFGGGVLIFLLLVLIGWLILG